MPANYEMRQVDCCQAFAASYEVSHLPAMLGVEQGVLGCDYGGTSWTTRQQAALIGEMLDLRAGVHLLDVGAGSGWPGLYLADLHGCEATLVDLPINALAKARRRAADDGIDSRIAVIAASGAALPFRDGSFDAISHSDVLCCLSEKRDVLRECRRVAGDGARMLFSVIVLPRDLTAADHRRAVDAGPPFVDTDLSYPDLLSQCGWQIVEHIDCTAEYRDCLRALVDAYDNNPALSEALGGAAVSDGRARRQTQIDAIDAGLLIREMYLVDAVQDDQDRQPAPCRDGAH